MTAGSRSLSQYIAGAFVLTASSSLSLLRQIQKIKSFAHREFSKEIDPVIVKHRLDNGKDPYGRGAEYDCHRTMEHAWLCFL